MFTTCRIFQFDLDFLVVFERSECSRLLLLLCSMGSILIGACGVVESRSCPMSIVAAASAVSGGDKVAAATAAAMGGASPALLGLGRADGVFSCDVRSTTVVEAVEHMEIMVSSATYG